MIEESARTEEGRREVRTMTKTIADVLREEGEKKGLKKGRKEGNIEGRQETLLEQLQEKFGKVPPETQAVIKATTSAKRLKQWSKRLVSATTLQEMQITASS
jgi:hypothetical protein